MKSDLKKIGLKIIDGFKSIFISFFTEIREMIRFMANWLVEIRILREGMNNVPFLSLLSMKYMVLY